jgi:hypothetical protein
MMTIGDITALARMVCTLREDWSQQYRAVEAQITKLAEDYDHPDVAYAAVQIARDHTNRAPVTLTIKAPDLIARLHATTTNGPRTPGPAAFDDQWKCDTCGLRQDVCQASAGNRGDDYHPFVSIADAEAQRNAEWALAGKERRTIPTDMFTLPSDV